MISIEEAKAIAELFSSGLIGITFSAEVHSGLKKIFAVAGVSDKDLVECPNCIQYFDNTDGCCPVCGSVVHEDIVIGNVVELPDPDYHKGYNWREGATGVVSGIETIDGTNHAIILTPDGREWCVCTDELTAL